MEGLDFVQSKAVKHTCLKRTLPLIGLTLVLITLFHNVEHFKEVLNKHQKMFVIKGEYETVKYFAGIFRKRFFAAEL